MVAPKLDHINAVSTNPIIEYYLKIQSGDEIVSKKVERVYRHLVEDLLLNPDSEWEYDETEAGIALDFIQQHCKHTVGSYAGKPFLLELWQQAAVVATFAIVHKIDGTRKHQEVILLVARKNGKSTFAAAIGLYLLIADAEMGPAVYAVATKRDQARIIWLEARRMVRRSENLRRHVKTLTARIETPFNDGVFEPLGRDSDTLDGLNVHGATMDEIHAWTDMNLYDVVADGTSSRENPLLFIISTAGTVRESVYDRLYDEGKMVINGYDDDNGYKNERMLPIFYELDKRDEWTDPSAWKKANPGLGTIKQYNALEQSVNRAKANPRLVRNLLTKDFNIPETASEAWLTFEQLNNIETFDITELKPRYGLGGVDLSSTTDLTCASVIFMLPNNNKVYVEQMYWLPEEVLEKREQEDKIPYSTWKKQGLLRTSQGNRIHYKDVTEWFVEMQQEKDIYIPWIGYDAWSAVYFVEEMKSHFGEESMEPVHQGYKTLSSPMKSLGADLEMNRIIYNNNPILKWNLSNVSYEEDKNGNIRPVKGNNPRRRVDGFDSLLAAYITLERHQEEYMSMV